MANNISAPLMLSNVKVCNGSFIQTFTQEAFLSITIITVAILVFAIPANILVLIGYLKSSSALSKPSNYLLVNLTISEFILALVVIPLQLLVHFIKPSLVQDHVSLCVAVGVLTYPFYIAVTITMICISVDRFYAIQSPLSYKFKISRKRVVYMIIYTWLHSAAFVGGFGLFLGIGFNPSVGVCGIFWDKNMAVSSMSAFTHIMLPFFLVLGLNINLVYSLRNQNRTFVNTLDQRQNQMCKIRQGEFWQRD